MQNTLSWSFYSTPLHPLWDFAHLLPHCFIKSMEKRCVTLGNGQNRRFFSVQPGNILGMAMDFLDQNLQMEYLPIGNDQTNTVLYDVWQGFEIKHSNIVKPQQQELGITNSDTFPLCNILQNASELEVDINIKGVSNTFNLDINPSLIGCQLPPFLSCQDVVDCSGRLRINKSP